MADRSDVGKILVAFFAGTAVGALAALLFAPASGAETRRKIKEVSLSAKDKVAEKAEAVKTGAVSLFTRGKEKVSDVGAGVKAAVEAAVEAGKEAYRQKKEELTSEEEKSESEA